MSGSGHFPFLNLPAETRNAIYESAIEPTTVAGRRRRGSCLSIGPIIPPLAQVCRQIRAEFMPMHRRITQHCVCIQDVVDYMDIIFSEHKNVQPDVMETWEGKLKIHFPFYQSCQRVMKIKYDLLPLVHFCTNAPKLELEFTSGLQTHPSTNFLQHLFKRGPSLRDWVATHKATVFQAKLLFTREAGRCIYMVYTIQLKKVYAPAWLREYCGDKWDPEPVRNGVNWGGGPRRVPTGCLNLNLDTALSGGILILPPGCPELRMRCMYVKIKVFAEEVILDIRHIT